MKYLLLAAIAAFAFTACQPPANTTAINANAANANANASANANHAAAAAPTKDAIMTLERSAYDAWKNKDAKFWDSFLTENFVGFGEGGKLNKASATKQYSGADCDVKSVSTSDEQLTQLGNDAVLLTHKAAEDGTCGGQKLPANSWVATVYTREGDKWKGAFHAESPIPDPNAPKAKTAAPAAKPAASIAATEAKSDAAADSLLALEQKAWDAWKAKDAKGLEEWAGKDMIAFTSKGRSDRTGAIKTWTEDKCEVKSALLTNPASVSLGSDFSLLTFKANPEGKCGSEALTPEYGITIYGKEGGVWKAVFTMGSPVM